MQVAVFSAKPYDRQFLDRANAGRHDLRYLEARLTAATAPFAQGAAAVCLFANDHADRRGAGRRLSSGLRNTT